MQRGVKDRGARGQTTIEVAALALIVVVAVVAMSGYLRRAFAGYARSNATPHGFQFDPNGAFTVNQTMSLTQTQDITTKQGPDVTAFDGDDEDLLPSTAGGATAGDIITTTTKVLSEWNVTRDGDYTAN